MASAGANQPSALAQSSSPQAAASTARSENSQEELSSSPVEMRTLTPPGATPSAALTTAQTSDDITTSIRPAEFAVPQNTEKISANPPQTAGSLSATPAPPTSLDRSETEAIGPSTDTPATVPDTSNGPVVVIMLLLPSTGARHPYKIDEKYLKKRSVEVENMDPYNISVYTLKELIWRDWREEWELRPTSPSSIRLIHFGRMLDDKSPLKDCRFQTESPNVVHMTVKPQEVVDDEDAKTGKGASRREGEEEPTAGCRCVIL